MEPDANAPAAPAEGGDAAAEQTTTSYDRYIPYSGGSAGWFENSGVLKSEQPNNYQFRVEMDRPEVRSRQFERWGPAFDRRGDERKRHRLPVNLVQGSTRTAVTTWDINTRGIRLQFTEPTDLKAGEQLQVELLDVPEGSAVITLDAQVVWVEESGATHRLWNVGIYFPTMTADDAAVMTDQLGV